MHAVNLSTERKKQLFILALMIASYLPFLLLAEFPSADSGSLIRWFAAQTGFAGGVMLLWQFLLGTRSVSSKLIADQVWALKIHKNIGIYAIALILAHPFLIAYSYSETLSYIFALDFSSEFQRHVSFGRVGFFIFLFVWLTSAILRSNIGYRPWKYIHYLTYPLLLAVLLHAPDIGTFTDSVETIALYWNGMFVVFVLLVIFRLARIFTFSQRQYTLDAKKTIGEDIVMYRLKPVGKFISPSAGQFVYLRAGFMSEEHPFSVASFNAKTGELTVAAKIFGRYTKRLATLDEGTTFYVDGPYGVFTQEVHAKDTPATFIAGGIGITPFLQHILSSKSKKITVFNANRMPKNVVFGSLLKDRLKDRYIEVFSDESAPKGSKKGYVTAGVLKESLGESFSKQDFYICGPPPMMAAVKKSLLAAGIEDRRIHTEEFSL